MRLARAITCEGIDSDKGPLGLGRPSFGLKQVRINIANSNQVVVATCGDTFLIVIAYTGCRHTCMRDFSHCKYFAVEHDLFQVFNFRIPLHIRKFFNAEIFPKLRYALTNKELQSPQHAHGVIKSALSVVCHLLSSQKSLDWHLSNS